MDLLTLIATLIFTFGLISFGTLSVLWVRDVKTSACRTAISHGMIVVFSTVWFAALLFTTGLKMFRAGLGPSVELAMWSMAFLWPPMIMHMMYGERVSRVRRPGLWRAVLVAVWVVSASAATLPLGYLAGAWPSRWLAAATVVFASMFTVTAVYCVLMERAGRRRETAHERTNRFWNLLLWGLVVVVMGSIAVGRPAALDTLFGLLGPAFPLLFVFVNTYFMERLTFFDIFVKRGSFLLLALLLLAGFFNLTASLWTDVALEGARVWVSILLFLPLALSLPWLYNALNTWLDRVWLGRRFSAQEAVKHFLAGTQSATSEPELIARAEQLLHDIFQAPVNIVSESAQRDGEGAPADEDAPTIEVPIRVDGSVAGSVRVGRRENRIPLFSRDVALLVSLSEVLSYNLENVRLQSRKQDQEKRARELKIHASRSELKALRAQINPHFLFNALNAIASLIPREPERAEATVEQLAEVFRYTLRESDKEWTRLEDEMEFVRAYLEVEKARFGERLSTEIVLEPSLNGVRIPTMIVQTLVENAIKHGIMMVRKGGHLRVEALQKEDWIRIEVADSGPGFGRQLLPGEVPPSAKGTGFGLRSVKERLEGYFGGRARLELGRDESRELTIVAIEFPSSLVSFERRTGTQS